MPIRMRGAKASRGHVLFARFLKDHDISYARAGRDLGVSRVTAYHWAIGAKDPSEENQKAIEVWTSGVIPAASWPQPPAAKRVIPFRPTGSD